MAPLVAVCTATILLFHQLFLVCPLVLASTYFIHLFQILPFSLAGFWFSLGNTSYLLVLSLDIVVDSRHYLIVQQFYLLCFVTIVTRLS